MHTNLNCINRIALLSTIALGIAIPSHGSTTFFSFGSTEYVTGGHAQMAGHTPGNATGGSDQYGEPDGYPLPNATVGRGFSDSVAFSPSSGGANPYSGPTFYGGGSVTSSDSTDNEGFHQLSVENGGGGDAIHWFVDSNTGDNHEAHLLIYFKKAQFDPSWTGTTITSADMSNASFNLHTGSLSQSGPNDTALYWVVKDGTQFYVAQTPKLIAQNSGYSTSFSSITAWALYDPTASLAALDFNEASTFIPHTFTDIQGFGFYIEHEDPQTSSHGEIDGFSVTPEPSRALLALGGLGLALLRRRRRSPL